MDTTVTLRDRIQDSLNRLPVDSLVEVADFLEFLIFRSHFRQHRTAANWLTKCRVARAATPMGSDSCELLREFRLRHVSP